jgi:uncharacterized damage-inducible protein DinB
MSMNDGLIDGFRHNTWATHQVLQACASLTNDQLNTTVTGTYGSIIATLRHLVSSEGGYCRRLTGEEPDWYANRDNDPDIAELARRVDDLASRWERFLAEPFDAERLFIIPWHDGIDRDVPAGIVFNQVLHHGNEHRTQLNTTLTAIGVQTPDLGLWDFAEATNRAPQRITV